MKKIFWLTHPIFVIYRLFPRLLPDSLFLKCQYFMRIGKKLNLRNPKTFNEKLQWLKLHDRKPEYTTMVDKYEVKKYVAEKIGEQYIIPTLGVWDKFDDIDFNTLPDQFVLKCTHDSGGLVIVKDKKQFDEQAAREKIEKCLRQNYYFKSREWAYKNIDPKIIAEKYMEDYGKIVPEDYKVYCFNGNPKYVVIFHNRFSKTKPLEESVYDTQWNKIDISLDDHFQISSHNIERPACLEELIRVSKILSENLPQVRVDFYIINNKIYFGEITLYTASGMQKMIPEEYDEILGSLVKLPIDSNMPEIKQQLGGEHLHSSK